MAPEGYSFLQKLLNVRICTPLVACCYFGSELPVMQFQKGGERLQGCCRSGCQCLFHLKPQDRNPISNQSKQQTYSEHILWKGC